MSTDTTDVPSIIIVDFGQSLGAMIAAGKYDWVNPKITPDNFSLLESSGTKRFRFRLFDFGRYALSEDVVAAMRSDNFIPATHIHGLAYGATFTDEQLKYPIVCLGSSAQVSGVRVVVCLGRGVAGRGLSLYDRDGGWGGIWRFLAVQEVVSDT